MSFKEYLKEAQWRYVQDEETIKEEPIEIETKIQVTGTTTDDGMHDVVDLLCGENCQYLNENGSCGLFEVSLKEDDQADMYRRTNLCFNIR
jgi:hypothetical protein